MKIGGPILRVVLAALALVTILAGCAQLPTGPMLPERPPSDTITRFAFHGRLAIRQGENRHHVHIDWQHAPARDEILLTTPFGQGVAEIVRDAAGARLTLPDRREFAAADPDRLAEQVFGFPLPLGNAAVWLLGRTDRAAPWRITVIARESDAPHALPGTLELEHEDIHVHLKIDEWSEVQ